jgi:hypothetical protein
MAREVDRRRRVRSVDFMGAGNLMREDRFCKLAGAP